MRVPPPDPQLGLSVVIPCHNEPNICRTLDSLAHCAPAVCAVEVWVVVNASTGASESIQLQNQQSLQSLSQWQQQNTPFFKLNIIEALQLPPKHAGVGLARKLAMDTAAERLKAVGNYKAPIVNLDADCEVSSNYFQAIEAHFKTYPKTPGASLYYAHPLTGDLPEDRYTGIVYYELFLRYYTHALRYAGFPFGFQTVGSAMAVRANVYHKVGGMNRRKAGEDFYFLHKVIDQGRFSEMNEVTVIPSPRVSDRVPFGTGKAIGDFIAAQDSLFLQHPLAAFDKLSALCVRVPDLYNASVHQIETRVSELDPVLRDFLNQQKVTEKITEIQNNTTHFESFEKRFFQWFNGFRAMKALHALRDAYGEADLCQESALLLQKAYGVSKKQASAAQLLQIYRDIDRSSTPFLLK